MVLNFLNIRPTTDLTIATPTLHRCHQSLPSPVKTKHPQSLFSQSSSAPILGTTESSGGPDLLFLAHLTHYIPNCPYISLPMLQTREAPDLGLQLSTPASTPEPYAEQDGVALAAEMGNPDAWDLVLGHFRTTGSYTPSNV